jgi:hypothetical protein
LALVVAELIRALGQAVAPAEADTAGVAAAPASIAPPRPSAARPAELSLELEGEARGALSRDTILWGARLRFSSQWSAVYAELDLGGDFARTHVDQGDVLLRSASAGLGMGPRFATGVAIIELGLRAELGWAWIRGETARTDVQTGAGSDLIANAGLRLSLAAPARGKVRPSLAVESGGVIRGVKGVVNRQDVAGITGYYWLVSLGIAISP